MADQRLKDRITVITGASSGLGKATAFKFAAAGARIVCADLKSVGIEDEINAKHGSNTATFVTCDVTKEDQIQNMIRDAVKFGGRLDAILNYAGVALETKHENARTDSFPTEDFDLEMAINCRGVWLCCKYALQQMLKQEPRALNARGDQTRGWIVNAASIYGTTAAAQIPAYAPSKFAVVGMTKQMAVDYAKDKIHINALCPGFVDTPIISRITARDDSKAAAAARHPWNSLGRPEDIADAALFLCSDESAWMTGSSMIIDGGYTAH
ncbi:Putative short-chain dehydrogenase/reductase SDR, NAD(P)-binding domain superfamily [Septoria linicola]|uniref:Short-chain dehydrogenase/reductase SDR, NAD(P)-binding domain superfamily n=1 Tax=Septoria linicola TaxID=215465 RepID=A0A9Q9AFX5_9PEZI|nr:putative short-chain dehydrogenase/reductase SDR, NAD(P)-binding domain superfamily [Septoria linicola]USW48337.1 Putative short-chain dehydrogenase/reductase SDR, NAD(P)-binding domain superfamily [Septoria linicola]